MKASIGRLLSGAAAAAMHALRGTTTALVIDQAAPRPSAPTARKDAPATVLAAIRIEVILGR